MKYHELPDKHKRQARQWAVDAWNELYESQGIPLVGENAPEVVDLYTEREYEIERGEYEPGVRYERLTYA